MSFSDENAAARDTHWHRAGRVKKCTSCQKEQPIIAFSPYSYTTKQGKTSTRYRSKCGPCLRACRISRYAEKGENMRASSQAWKDRNRDHVIAYSRGRQADEAHRTNKAKSQRLRKARARSGQGDNAAIRAIYAKAMEIERIIAPCPVFALPELGYKMHVDHIKALANGGLHHEGNLQILPAGINMRKGVK